MSINDPFIQSLIYEYLEFNNYKETIETYQNECSKQGLVLKSLQDDGVDPERVACLQVFFSKSFIINN